METAIKNPRGRATSRQDSRPPRGLAKPMLATVAVLGLVAVAWLGMRMSGGQTTGAADIEMPAAAPPAAVPAQIAGAKVFYVAVNGSPAADGSIAAPIDLATALSYDGPVAAGDTVWLRGGVYKGAFKSSLRGAEDAPILVRQYPGERAVIDSGSSSDPALTVDGAWTWYWGFEVMSSEPQRASGPQAPAPTKRVGIWSTASNVRFINLVVHDLAGGIHLEQGSSHVELYGNVVYYNGWQDPEVPHGTAIETQGVADALYVRENIVFRQLRNGIEVLNTSKAAIHLEGNVAFDNGTPSSHRQANLLVAGGLLRLVDNHTFFTPGGQGGTNIIGYNLGCARLEAKDNYWIHLRGYPLDLAKCDGRLSGNVMAGIIHESLTSGYADNSYHSDQLPSGVKTFVRPNHYEPGRANIIVHNWDRVAAVKIDLSKAGLANGSPYEIRNVQNYHAAAVVSGVFDGRPIMLRFSGLETAPMIGEVAAAPPREPIRDFGVFVVLPTKSATTRPTSPDHTNP